MSRRSCVLLALVASGWRCAGPELRAPVERASRRDAAPIAREIIDAATVARASDAAATDAAPLETVERALPPVASERLDVRVSFAAVVANTRIESDERALYGSVASGDPSIMDGVWMRNLHVVSLDDQTLWLHAGREAALELSERSARLRTLASDLWVGDLRASGRREALFLGVREGVDGLALLDATGARRWRVAGNGRSSPDGRASDLRGYAMRIVEDHVRAERYVVSQQLRSVARVDLARATLREIAAPPPLEDAMGEPTFADGALYQCSQRGAHVWLNRWTQGASSWQRSEVRVGAQLGAFSPCSFAPHAMSLLGALSRDVLIAQQSDAIVFVQTDGVVVSVVDFSRGVARRDRRVSVAVDRCGGVRVVDGERPSEASRALVEVDDWSARLVAVGASGPEFFVHGDCRPQGRGLAPRVVRPLATGRLARAPGSCREQQSRAWAGQVMPHFAVSNDGSVFGLVRERDAVFAVRVRVGTAR